jgi:hypothetical protein
MVGSLGAATAVPQGDSFNSRINGYYYRRLRSRGDLTVHEAQDGVSIWIFVEERSAVLPQFQSRNVGLVYSIYLCSPPWLEVKLLIPNGSLYSTLSLSLLWFIRSLILHSMAQDSTKLSLEEGQQAQPPTHTPSPSQSETEYRTHSAASSRDGILQDKKQAQDGGAEWKPGKQEYAVMITIAVVSLMVALDATILVPVLPVRKLHTVMTTP